MILGSGFWRTSRPTRTCTRMGEGSERPVPCLIDFTDGHSRRYSAKLHRSTLPAPPRPDLPGASAAGSPARASPGPGTSLRRQGTRQLPVLRRRPRARQLLEAPPQTGQSSRRRLHGRLGPSVRAPAGGAWRVGCAVPPRPPWPGTRLPQPHSGAPTPVCNRRQQHGLRRAGRLAAGRFWAVPARFPGSCGGEGAALPSREVCPARRPRPGPASRRCAGHAGSCSPRGGAGPSRPRGARKGGWQDV